MTAAPPVATGRRRGAALLVSMLLAAVGVGVLALAAPAEATTGRTVRLDLGLLVPGVTSTATATLDVPVRARVVDADWISVGGLDGLADWTAALCLRARCIPLAQLTGTVLAPGDWQLQVTARLPAGARPSEALGQADGRIVMSQAVDGGLAATGVPLLSLLLVAALSIGVGVVVLRGGRRRSDDPT